MLRYDGEALSRGLLVWQGDDNLYDRRLHAFVVPAGASEPVPQQTYATWARLWGSSGDRGPLLDLNLTRTLDWSRLADQLGRLEIPSRPRTAGPRPGADLTRLGIKQGRGRR